MKRDMSKIENIKEEDLNDINKVNNAPEIDELPPRDMPQQALDDARRVKVISPGLLVAKRFFRNKLAIVGLLLLLFMFAFCFLGAWIIPYDQKQVFYKYGTIVFDYGTATERTSYENYYLVKSEDVHYSVKHMMNSHINNMNTNSLNELTVKDTSEEEKEYKVVRKKNNIFSLIGILKEDIAIYNNQVYFAEYNANIGLLQIEEGTVSDENVFKTNIESNVGSTFVFDGVTYEVEQIRKNQYKVYKHLTDGVFTYEGESLGAGFEAEFKANISNISFSYDGNNFEIKETDRGEYSIAKNLGEQTVLYASTYVFDRYDVEAMEPSSELKIAIFSALAKETKTFSLDGTSYSISKDEKDNNLFVSKVVDGKSTPYTKLNTFVVRRYNGEDTLPQSFKEQVNIKVDEMKKNSKNSDTFTYYTQLLDEEGNPQIDENGKPVQGEAEFFIERKDNNFMLTNYQEKYLIDTYSRPSKTHWLGTDGNGMDVLTRIMYGGRISLLIGFVVIFLSLFIGVILGGIAGYFGGWIDNVIMRLVDVFNCIPTMPILIILGALFDQMRLEPLTRIMYLMVILGVLGWSGIARLVRGQILSLREQEFMLAAEATGLKPSRRIFRHLIPNVMPQLIVNATMGLGGIILTESTLSFLGLGAKYPLATWGAMINSVSSASAMSEYTYIWIPVGVLICLTVIAFNFVGDGLRDAFDPKMKR